jgi:hypothetical protein
MIAAPEHQECILAMVMDDITRKSTSTPGGGPATIKLVNLPLPAA